LLGVQPPGVGRTWAEELDDSWYLIKLNYTVFKDGKHHRVLCHLAAPCFENIMKGTTSKFPLLAAECCLQATRHSLCQCFYNPPKFNRGIYFTILKPSCVFQPKPQRCSMWMGRGDHYLIARISGDGRQLHPDCPVVAPGPFGMRLGGVYCSNP